LGYEGVNKAQGTRRKAGAEQQGLGGRQKIGTGNSEHGTLKGETSELQNLGIMDAPL
jgi:hypothetical protein